VGVQTLGDLDACRLHLSKKYQTNNGPVSRVLAPVCFKITNLFNHLSTRDELRPSFHGLPEIYEWLHNTSFVEMTRWSQVPCRHRRSDFTHRRRDFTHRQCDFTHRRSDFTQSRPRLPVWREAPPPETRPASPAEPCDTGVTGVPRS